MKVFKRILLVLLILIIAVVIVVGAYVVYLSVNYYRIDDNKELSISGSAAKELKTGQKYTALTYNIGFGAYNRDFSFFMDNGTMKDGTEVTGKYAKAVSEEAAAENTGGVIEVALEENADFNLFQEVDQESTRSWFINQEELIIEALESKNEIDSTFASNFHSVFLAYPFRDPIGSIQSGILTTSEYKIQDSVRRSFPVTDSFVNKFFDLDRCFAVNRIAVDGKSVDSDPHLVMINVHMSAYDKGGTIRKQQMEMLSGVLTEEMNKGNWVIVGGDFNHALYGTDKSYDSDQEIPEWVQPFDEQSLPEGVSVVKANNVYDVATVRSTDIPYEEGVNYLAVLDGFIVSDNVKATARNVDAGFYYSDHNPVLLRFELF